MLKLSIHYSEVSDLLISIIKTRFTLWGLIHSWEIIQNSFSVFQTTLYWNISNSNIRIFNVDLLIVMNNELLFIQLNPFKFIEGSTKSGKTWHIILGLFDIKHHSKFHLFYQYQMHSYLKESVHSFQRLLNQLDMKHWFHTSWICFKICCWIKCVINLVSICSSNSRCNSFSRELSFQPRNKLKAEEWMSERKDGSRGP